jgi:hypothetical protein
MADGEVRGAGLSTEATVAGGRLAVAGGVRGFLSPDVAIRGDEIAEAGGEERARISAAFEDRP